MVFVAHVCYMDEKNQRTPMARWCDASLMLTPARSMLARCGQTVRAKCLGRRPYTGPTTARMAARSPRSQRQRTVQLDDLPHHASDLDGRPLKALSAFQPGVVPTTVLTKGKEPARESEEPLLDAPRLAELGRECETGKGA